MPRWKSPRITSDNTYDGTGWGALYISTGREVKEFRVDASDNTYGVSGFVYTDRVEYQHMVYEFKIPLAEVGATVGDTVRIGYGAYGTAPSFFSSGIRVVGEIMMYPNCNNTIQYNTLYEYDNGIVLEFTDNETIAYNQLYNNTEGIFLTGCRDIDVLYNIILFDFDLMGFGYEGIWDGMMFCHNNLSYNTISGYEFGIYAGYTDNETILGNNISFSYYAGIWLESVWDSTVGHNTLYVNGMHYGPGAPSNILMTAWLQFLLENRKVYHAMSKIYRR